MFYLMEMLRLGYDDALALPYSRRKRILEQKDKLETKRQQAQRQAMQASAHRRRGR